MEILLIGYGKMGKIIEAIALERGHTIAGKVDNQDELSNFRGTADVAIEFSQPDAVIDNLKYCFEKRIPVVCGTTGWLEKKNEMETLCKQKQSAFFYASNYSLGVNLFFKLNEYLAKLMNGRSGYDVFVDETHHTQKKDAPSGTAISIAEGIIKNNPSKKRWRLNVAHDSSELPIRSFRVDPAPGTHSVLYKSAVDDIFIQHTAHSRQGFALGAVLVAEWLAGKSGVYSMDDFLKF
ncbi:MAG TPA: 4-hydroxy-tetrahydrodipicolinate reductase [Cyclobacteriaceae bacterium]|jgi:4-hydroxy-tetrahydrodipicolinate reductase|nr:4-hydroxy-tetrahydrodipicolinate reductase [Cyclobacteriaceae bacterium]